MTENDAVEVLKDEHSYGYELNKACLIAIKSLEEIQQYREYKEIFESHFSEEALKLLSDKEEFGKWLERGRWIAKKCDEINRELEQYRVIGTIEEFKALKEADMRGTNRAVDEFANYLHKIAKENNGLRLSSETRSWTHPCIFDYLEEFKNEQICKAET